MLCSDLNGKEIKKREDISKHIAPDHVTYLLRNLYIRQEATVRTGHGTTDWI